MSNTSNSIDNLAIGSRNPGPNRFYLSTASSYSNKKIKKDLHAFYDSSASDQERSDASGDDELEDDFIGFTPQVSHRNTRSKKQRMSISGQENAAKLNKTGDREHQLKGSFSRNPATTTRQTPIEKKKKVRTNSDSDYFFQEPESLSEKIDKKTKPGPSARNKEKATTKNPPSAKKRGKTNAESRSTETGDSPEPAAKRPMVALERKAISSKEPATSSTEHVDKDNITKNNPRGNKVSTIVDEVVETDLSAGGSKSKPKKSADPTLGENKGRSRGFGRPKRHDISAERVPGKSSSSPTKSLDNHSRVETKKSEAKNDEAHGMTLKTADKSKERKYRFLSSSESEVEDEVEDEEDDKVEDEVEDEVGDEEADKVEDEEDDKVEDEEDDEDDNIFLSRQKTKSHTISVPSPTIKTPASVANKVSEFGTPKTSKFRFLPEPVPPPRTPRRTLTLVKEPSPNRVEQPTSIPEEVANAELPKRSLKETPLIRPSTSRANEESSEEETPLSKRRRFPDSSKKQSPTKRLQSPVKSSQQLNDLENDIYAHGDDSGLIEEVLKRTMLRSANSTNQAPLSSAIDPSTLPVPNRSHLRTQFNLYLASPGEPVRVQELSNAEHSMSLVHLLPKIVFALKINNPIMAVRLKGSVEFRSNPHVPSRILLNSSTRLVDLKAGILHVVNTGEEVASFVLFETFQ